MNDSGNGKGKGYAEQFESGDGLVYLELATA